MLVTIGQHFTRPVNMAEITCGEWSDNWQWDEIAADAILYPEEDYVEWQEEQSLRDIEAALYAGIEQRRGDIESDNDKLCKICDEVISDWQARIYQGRKTHGNIMVEAMLRYTKKYSTKPRGFFRPGYHERKVPSYWYPIAKKLRKGESCNTTKTGCHG